MATIKRLDNGKWRARVRRSGSGEVSKTFETKKEAEFWVRNIEALCDNGLSIKKQQIYTLQEVFTDYLNFHKLDKSSTKPNQLDIASFDLGKIQVNRITSSTLDEYLKRLLNTPLRPAYNKKSSAVSKNVGKCYSKSTVCKIFYAIKGAMIWHSKHYKYKLVDDLFTDVNLPDPWEKSNDRRLQSGEYQKIMDKIATLEKYKDSFRHLVNFALETGMRLQEMIYAKWGDLSSDRKGLYIPHYNVKTGSSRTIPLTKNARAILAELEASKNSNSDLIFWEFNGKAELASNTHRRVMKKAKITGFTFHSFRHEALSRLAETRELSLNELMSVSGHTNTRTFARYLKFYADVLADRLDSKIIDRS